MRAQDLDLSELLDFEPSGGVIRFAGRRAVIFDAVALGVLRSQLIETLGLAGARGVLTRFGYAHGWRTAEALKDAFPWDSELEWKRAGGRLHRLQGLVVFEPAPENTAPGAPFAEAVWHDSYEAEQHLLNHGRADEAVCWSLCGFASGYLSYCHGREIFCFEDRCRGKGDAVCSMVGRPREEWEGKRDDEVGYFTHECLDASLKAVADALKTTERKLRSRRQELARVKVEEEQTGIVARSEAMLKVLDLATRVAKVDSTALITGESGVGKEVIARLIHDESGRAGRPFIAINCGAVPESLLESELFGHARGAFTGATHDRPGLFEAAHGGTLFLDEVGEIPQLMQVKLLRALQEREVRRVGENKNRAVDVRVVAATNRDLVAEVKSGRFRQDFFYRLRVVELRIPPLRDRKDDILPLARAFLADAGARLDRRLTGFTPQAAQHLMRYAWPGNVRELQNAVERAVVLAQRTRVDVEDLPEEVAGTAPVHVAVDGDRPLEEVEREHILHVLSRSDGNRARAAEVLKIGTATLFRKIKQYRDAGFSVPD